MVEYGFVFQVRKGIMCFEKVKEMELQTII